MMRLLVLRSGVRAAADRAGNRIIGQLTRCEIQRENQHRPKNVISALGRSDFLDTAQATTLNISSCKTRDLFLEKWKSTQEIYAASWGGRNKY